MSMYRCFECEEIKDADDAECEIHPANDCELICWECLNKMIEGMQMNDDDFDKNNVSLWKCTHCYEPALIYYEVDYSGEYKIIAESHCCSALAIKEVA